MRVPSSLLNSTVTVTRRTVTGSGVVDGAVAVDVPAHVTSTVKMTITAQGTTAMSVTKMYLHPEADIRTGDTVTVDGGEKVTVRSVSKPTVLRTASVTIVEAW